MHYSTALFTNDIYVTWGDKQVYEPLMFWITLLGDSVVGVGMVGSVGI